MVSSCHGRFVTISQFWRPSRVMSRTRQPVRPATAPANGSHERGAVLNGVAAAMFPLERLGILRDAPSDILNESLMSRQIVDLASFERLAQVGATAGPTSAAIASSANRRLPERSGRLDEPHDFSEVAPVLEDIRSHGGARRFG